MQKRINTPIGRQVLRLAHLLTCRMRGRRLGPTSVRRSPGRLSVAPRTCRSFLTAGATQTPILPSSRRTKDTEMCNLIRYSARRIEGRIRRLRRCRRGHATSPGIGVKPSFYLTRSTSSQVVCSKGARKKSCACFFVYLPHAQQKSSILQFICNHTEIHQNTSLSIVLSITDFAVGTFRFPCRPFFTPLYGLLLPRLKSQVTGIASRHLRRRTSAAFRRSLPHGQDRFTPPHI